MSDTPKQTTIVEQFREHAHLLFSAVPFARAIGIELISVDPARAKAKVGWREDLVGDPDTGVIHGGVITTLLDNLCGAAVLLALREFRTTATLDLRISYMRPAEKGRDVIADAECYHVTRHIAFVRASAYHENDDRVIATASGTFSLNDPGKWGGAVAEAVSKALENRT